MNRNYETPLASADLADWARTRETHMAVATAIHAIASRNRSPEAVWEAPTPAEWDHVAMAVEEYVRHDDFAYDPDGYAWGLETVKA